MGAGITDNYPEGGGMTSSKTKAELQAEINALRRENDTLRENLRDVMDLSDAYLSDRKIISKAHKDTISTMIPMVDKNTKLNYDNTVLGDEVETLVIQNKNRGGNSYKQYRPVYDFARRYYRMALRREPNLEPGRAAGRVRKHCLKLNQQFKYVPTQKRIKAHLQNK